MCVGLVSTRREWTTTSNVINLMKAVQYRTVMAVRVWWGPTIFWNCVWELNFHSDHLAMAGGGEGGWLSYELVGQIVYIQLNYRRGNSFFCFPKRRCVSRGPASFLRSGYREPFSRKQAVLLVKRCALAASGTRWLIQSLSSSSGAWGSVVVKALRY
jgi:hypothetical protein